MENRIISKCEAEQIFLEIKENAIYISIPWKRLPWGFACNDNKNKPPAMQVCSQLALVSSKNLLCYNKCRFTNRANSKRGIQNG